MSVEKINGLIDIIGDLNNYLEKDSYLVNEKDSINKLKNVGYKLKNRKYTISVIAAMKAGKSTTFNALIGRDLLPNERAACTAAITEIKHSKSESDHILKIYTNGKKEKITAVGDKSLEEMFHEDVRNSRKQDGVNIIEKYYLETPIKALEGTDYEDLIQNFVLIDTPGPNEANIGDFDVTILQKLALDQLRNSDALIMLLDYESYKSETNAKILSDIFKNRDDLENEQSKVYFLLNKIDSMGSKDGTLEEVIDNVKKLIREYAPVIKEPKVYGFSGKQAMLSRCVINNTANDSMKKEMQDHYGSKFSKTILVDGEEMTVIPKADKFAVDLLKESKIEQIETEIISQVFKRASSDMLSGAITRLDSVINYIIGNADSQIKSLNKDSEELYAIIEKSKQELNSLKSKGNQLKAIPKKELENINVEIKAILKGMESNIDTIVEQQLPQENSIQSYDRDSLSERMNLMRGNALNSVQAYLNREVDKIQRICIEAQGRLNNKVNIEFNKLIQEATKDVNDEINFTARTFDINDTIDMYSNNGSFNIETNYENDGTYVEKEFTALGATMGTSGGAAVGAAVGSFVPIIGTAIGAAVGGLIGFFLGSKKNSVKEKQRQVFNADISSLKNEIISAARNAVATTNSEVEENINIFRESYCKLIDMELNKFIMEIDKDFEDIIKNYNKEKNNKEAKINHMIDIKMKMAQYLDKLDEFR